jgi:hypothetical protein
MNTDLIEKLTEQCNELSMEVERLQANRRESFLEIRDLQQRLEEARNRSPEWDFLSAVEFGYSGCENGWNLQRTLAESVRTLKENQA